MKKNINHILLFDLYNGFLTDRQKDIFKMYFEQDLSVNEISKEFDVSKQSIHKTLKNILMKLEKFENKLHLKKEILVHNKK